MRFSPCVQELVALLGGELLPRHVARILRSLQMALAMRAVQPLSAATLRQGSMRLRRW